MAGQAKNRILYVGPQANRTHQLLTKILSVKYDVHILSGKSTVLKAAQKDGYALFIVDEEQADVDGFELCRELRNLDAHTPILVYCSNVLQGKLRSVAQAGAQWCLSKPVDSYCLLSAVAWLINSATIKQPRAQKSRAHSRPRANAKAMEPSHESDKAREKDATQKYALAH